MLKPESSRCILPLIHEDGHWAYTDLDKPNLFADNSPKKWNLPLPAAVHEEIPGELVDFFVPLRRFVVYSKLKNLREDSAAGLDGIAAIVLRKMASIIDLPMT